MANASNDTLSVSNIIEDTRNISMVTPALNFLDIKSVTKEGSIDPGYITGCTFLPNGELVVCDGKNNAIKHFTPDFKLKSTFNTGFVVWDITAVSSEEVMATDRNKEQIQFLNISDTITKGKTIHVGMICHGIDYHNDRLYVSGYDDDYVDDDDDHYFNVNEGVDEEDEEEDGGGGGKNWKIKVLTMNGDLVNTFTGGQGIPNYISINHAGDKLLISDDSTGIRCTDTNGTTLYTYSDTELSVCRGVLFDSYDNFMVCGFGSHDLHVVKKDGSKHKILLAPHNRLYSTYVARHAKRDLIRSKKIQFFLTDSSCAGQQDSVCKKRT